MTERDRNRLAHMLDADRTVAGFASARTEADLASDPMFASAVMWYITVIGEAAARVSPDGRSALPTLPWADIVAMRNRLVHGYDSIRFDRVWSFLADDLPPLIAALEAALANNPDPG